jgi:hypothetical protein
MKQKWHWPTAADFGMVAPVPACRARGPGRYVRRRADVAIGEGYGKGAVGPDTPWAAARRNDVEALRRLLDQGADVDARDARGHSPLLLAAYAGSEGAFDLLLARGADPDATDDAGNTALMGATFKGYTGLVAKLLAAGADRSAKNRAGIDARAFAAMFGRSDAAALIARAGDGPPRRRRGRAAR